MTKLIIDENGVKRSLTRIAYEILEHNKGTDDLVFVGIKTRGIYLGKRLQDIVYRVEGTIVPLVDLDVYTWRDDIEERSQHPNIPFDINNKKIILIDDVLFKGRTIRAAMDAIIGQGRPKEIQLAVLIDRGHRELPIRADYVGKNIPSSLNEIIKVKVKEIDEEEGVFIIK